MDCAIASLLWSFYNMVLFCTPSTYVPYKTCTVQLSHYSSFVLTIKHILSNSSHFSISFINTCLASIVHACSLKKINIYIKSNFLASCWQSCERSRGRFSGGCRAACSPPAFQGRSAGPLGTVNGVTYGWCTCPPEANEPDMRKKLNRIREARWTGSAKDNKPALPRPIYLIWWAWHSGYTEAGGPDQLKVVYRIS